MWAIKLTYRKFSSDICIFCEICYVPLKDKTLTYTIRIHKMR